MVGRGSLWQLGLFDHEEWEFLVHLVSCCTVYVECESDSGGVGLGGTG